MKYIYKIECLVNHKVYIGQSNNPDRRYKEHVRALIHKAHYNEHLQNDFNKFGKEKFELSILEEVEDLNCSEKETCWIDYYGGIESTSTYNMTNLFTNNTEVRNKNRLAMLSDKHPLRGKHHTPETIQKIKDNARINPNYGMKNRHHTPETIQKIKSNERIHKGVTLGKRKHSKEFIELLRQQYLELGSYKLVSELHPNISYNIINNLINYGNPSGNSGSYPGDNWINTLSKEDKARFKKIAYEIGTEVKKQNKSKHNKRSCN